VNATTCREQGGEWVRTLVTLLVVVVMVPVAEGGHYLIVTPPDYAGSAPLTELATHRAATGLSVATYVVPAGTSNTTIKSYIESLWYGSNPPSYIVLIGDTSGFTSTSNTIPYFNGTGDKAAPTDHPYGCMPGGVAWYPDIPVGRLAVSSVQQLQNVVTKTRYVEGALDAYPDPNYVMRGAFLANNDTQGMSDLTHNWVIDNVFTPNGYTGIKVYQSAGGGTAQVTAAVNSGCLWVVYYGHSSASGWWGPSFTQSNVQALSNTGLYGLVCGWSCNTSDYTQSECFGETWIRQANKGSAAYISASTYIYWGSVEAWQPSTHHEKGLFAAFFDDGIWEVGPAHLRGLYRFLQTYGNWDGNYSHEPTSNLAVCHNFMEEFVLLGDPALRLPQRNEFHLAVDPVSQGTCSPPTNEAVYVIEVQEAGVFTEAVTLSAAGVPAGATVSFDVNSLPPPYTSHLTIGNLAGAAPGQYEIRLNAVAPSLQRGARLGLHVASGPPGTVTLTSPPHNASDVSRTPTLTWETLPQALNYDLQIATDPAFSSVVYAIEVDGNSHVVAQMLESDTDYFWHVAGRNACGAGGYSTAFRFHTMAQADYFTEQFTSGHPFDLDYSSITLAPDGSGNYYQLCAVPATAFPVDPSSGTLVTLAEDACQNVTLTGGARVGPYGQSYSGYYICDNGYITFAGPDNDWTETLTEHFSIPRLSPLYHDLSKPGGGTIRRQQLSDRAVVTYIGVPEYNTTNSNNIQVEMFFDGTIRFTWLQVDAVAAVVGISAGNGYPSDFVASDLSAYGPCPGDLDTDGDVDMNDYTVFAACMAGPGVSTPPGGCTPTAFGRADLENDADVDLMDFVLFEELLAGG